ncbi:alpha/beta-hydrolase [Polychaeton citri CBS 116435]|uniref:Alpha/beta-hydrolase n=1 Tax=Polychaeton citri CBS 116435 TaxID=1314669 RepID=A0A9P4Q5M4_9PEZI|nr:alpha/beta-hydrolase [Polychaeton citri CBS 116435]
MDLTDKHLLTLDPELDSLFKERGLPKLPLPTQGNISFVRKGFHGAIQRFNNSAFCKAALGDESTTPTWTEADHRVPIVGRNGISLRLYVPRKRPATGAPVLVFMHAGGWFMGDLDTEAFLCRVFCAKLGLLVVNVAYGLHPEVPFGVPQDDCIQALSWTAANIEQYGGDLGSGFVVGGSSGGATWAAVGAHLWRDQQKQPSLTGCIFLAPIFTDAFVDGTGNLRFRYDHDTEYRSWGQCRDAPLMNEAMSNSIRELAHFDWASPLLTPFNFTNHQDLGATYCAACGIDPWRDGAVLYIKELQKANAPVRLDVYPGLPHCWWTTFPKIKATQSWLTKTLDGMQWVLEQSKTVKHTARL